jgi:hypothetical protein
MIKHEQSKKRSVRRKSLDAGWDNDYLLKILRNYNAFALDFYLTRLENPSFSCNFAGQT